MMMKLVMAFYEQAVAALAEGASLQKLIRMPVREQIGRFKYIHDTDLEEAYDKVIDELVSELADLTSKEDR